MMTWSEKKKMLLSFLLTTTTYSESREIEPLALDGNF